MPKPPGIERVLFVHFFRTENGSEPVREWLRDLGADDRKTIGEDIKTVELGWPIGMPLVRKMEPDLWEVRIDLRGRIARVLFTTQGNQMVLLHGFIKKSQETPRTDLNLSRTRLKQLQGMSKPAPTKESHHGKKAPRK
jgi:phage-related protein